MFGWLKDKLAGDETRRGQALYDTIQASLSEDDADQVRIVGSLAALLLCVAHADLEVAAEELELVEATLSRMRGLDARGVAAIMRVMHEQKVAITSAEASSYARELLTLTDEDFRLQALDLLVDLAAADGEIAVVETNMLRAVARALGLSQAQYNASQARHREKLAVLK